MVAVSLNALLLAVSFSAAAVEPQADGSAFPPPAATQDAVVERGSGDQDDDDEEEPAPRVRKRAVADTEPSDREALVILENTKAPLKQREAALRVVAFGSAPGTEAALIRLLEQDSQVSIRLLCARALEHRKKGAGALAQALHVDPDARVRRAAARALGRMGAEGTRQEAALVAALEDPVPAVATEAAMSLRNVGSRASLEALKALKEAEPRGLRTAARRAREDVKARVAARNAALAQEAEAQRLRLNPAESNPLVRRALRFGGTGWMVLSGGTLGAAAGALVPMMTWGNNATWLWPVGAGIGMLGGAAAGLGYSALRRFEVPLWDSLLISVHGASGFGAGLGYGLWLGNRVAPGSAAGLGLLGGGAAWAISAGVSPWMTTRPSAPLGAASGALLGGASGVLVAGMFGQDVLGKPELSLAVALMGQGVGTALGTVLTVAVPVTSLDILAVDTGALAGAGLATGGVLFGLLLPFTRINAAVANGAVLGGLVMGAGTGALVAAFLPRGFEDRLVGALSAEEWPIKLLPNIPVPILQPQRLDGPGAASGGSTTSSMNFSGFQGAYVPLFGGTFR